MSDGDRALHARADSGGRGDGQKRIRLQRFYCDGQDGFLRIHQIGCFRRGIDFRFGRVLRYKFAIDGQQQMAARGIGVFYIIRFGARIQIGFDFRIGIHRAQAVRVHPAYDYFFIIRVQRVERHLQAIIARARVCAAQHPYRAAGEPRDNFRVRARRIPCGGVRLDDHGVAFAKFGAVIRGFGVIDGRFGIDLRIFDRFLRRLRRFGRFRIGIGRFRGKRCIRRGFRRDLRFRFRLRGRFDFRGRIGWHLHGGFFSGLLRRFFDRCFFDFLRARGGIYICIGRAARDQNRAQGNQ